MNYRRQHMGTVIPFPYNVPMPYQIDPVSGKLVQAPSLLRSPGATCECGGSCGGCAGKRFPRLRKFGLGLRGLGDEAVDGGDGGGGFDFASGDGGGDLLSAGDGGGAGGSTPDASTDPFAGGNVTLPDGSTIDASGTTSLPDGSQIDSSGNTFNTDGSVSYANGDYLDTDGTLYFADGSVSYPDGSYLDASGNFFDASTSKWSNASTPQAQAQQQQADQGRSRGGGGAGGGGVSAGGGGSRKAGGGAAQTPMQQILCTLNPNQLSCGRQQKTAPRGVNLATKPASASTWLSQNWPWLAVAGGVVFVLPTLLPALGRR